MRDLYKKCLLGCAAVLLIAGPAAATEVTSQAALAPNDSIGWAQLGANDAILPPSDAVTSVGGLSATVSTAGSGFQRRDEGSGWSGNFTDGDAILWDNISGPNITITFAQAVFGFGAQIQADQFGAFTAQINLSNGNSFTEDGNSTSANDGSAIFIGALDGVADITSVTFDLTAASSAPNDFAIDTLFLRTGPSVQSVPEPVTLSLFGAGLLGAVALRRRGKKSA